MTDEIEAKPFNPFNDKAKQECLDLAKQHYYRFEKIIFEMYGLTVITGDQGGHPFEGIEIRICSDPKTVVEFCLQAMRSLKS